MTDQDTQLTTLARIPNTFGNARLNISNMNLQSNGEVQGNWKLDDVNLYEQMRHNRNNRWNSSPTPWWAWVLLTIGTIFILWLFFSNYSIIGKNTTMTTSTIIDTVFTSKGSVVIKTTDDVYNAVQGVKKDLGDHRREASNYATRAIREREDIKTIVNNTYRQTISITDTLNSISKNIRTHASQMVSTWNAKTDELAQLIRTGNGNVDSLRQEWSASFDSLQNWKNQYIASRGNVDHDN